MNTVRKFSFAFCVVDLSNGLLVLAIW